MKYHTLFFRELEKISQNLSSAAVMLIVRLANKDSDQTVSPSDLGLHLVLKMLAHLLLP